MNRGEIPGELMSPFGSYPNPLELNDDDRAFFHPVVKVPKGFNVPVIDCRNAEGLASAEEISHSRRRNRGWNILWKRLLLTQIWAMLHLKLDKVPLLQNTRPILHLVEQQEQRNRAWAIGKYDENRVEMYVSEHFQDTSKAIDGYSGLRTVHLGIDLGAPAGTKVYAFADGKVHSAGYNPDFGDYGYVIVIEHELLNTNHTVWALYGHLSQRSILGKTSGRLIRKGQVIGRIGDCHENGGWKNPHVHFQLSLISPESHDMPGASSLDDRVEALHNYPDPRYILGPLH